MLCFCAAQLKFWFQTDPGRENSVSYCRQGRHFLLTLLNMVTLYVQFLCSDWSKFDRWVYAESLRTNLKLVFFDSWSWQSFVSTCDVFNCLFPLDVQNEIQLLSGIFCYSWLVCFLGFCLRNKSLVEVGNPISDGIVFVFHLAWCVMHLSMVCPRMVGGYGVHLRTKIIENKRQFEVQKLDYPCRNLVIWIWNRNERSRNSIIRTWSYFEQVETI